jgi:hypothetical protein
MTVFGDIIFINARRNPSFIACLGERGTFRRGLNTNKRIWRIIEGLRKKKIGTRYRVKDINILKTEVA